MKHQTNLSASCQHHMLQSILYSLRGYETCLNLSLSTLTGTVRCNRQTIINLLISCWLLSTQFTQTKRHNAALRVKISELQELLSRNSCHKEAEIGNSSSNPEVTSLQESLIINRHQQEKNANASKSAGMSGNLRQ